VYAYLAASSLVVVTAGSVGLVTSVPLTRVGLGTTGATRHVAATSWLVLALVGGAAGVVAVAGADLVEAVLGAAYGGDVASDLRTTIVLLSPWMVAAVGVTLAFPLTFVVSRTRRLPVIAVSALVLLLPIAWLGARLAGIDGLALALGLVTMVMLLGLVRELEALEAASALAIAASLVAGLAVVAYGPLALVVGSIAAAVGGSAVYLGLLALLRPRGLVSSWRYLRALA
jgi:hypothetical protein